MSGSRKAQIQCLINQYKDIFDSSAIEATRLNSLIKEINNVLYLPYTTLDLNDGIKLADNAGYITIREESVNGAISYNYRFFSSEYEYLFSKKYEERVFHGVNYSFHFDKGDLKHLSPHISVLFPDIRYPSNEITLELFFSFIRDTFFSLSGGKYIKKSGLIWDDHFI